MMTFFRSPIITLLLTMPFSAFVYAEAYVETYVETYVESHVETYVESYAESYADNTKPSISDLCHEVGNKLASVSIKVCIEQKLISDGNRSNQQRLITYKTYPPLDDKKPLGRVLLMGGIHGDEYSTVSIVFKWMNTLDQYHSGLFHWKLTPLLNPDGLLKEKRSQRQNANGVDLNRNFPSKDWDVLAKLNACGLT
jgi:hypothetical protein